VSELIALQELNPTVSEADRVRTLETKRVRRKICIYLNALPASSAISVDVLVHRGSGYMRIVVPIYANLSLLWFEIRP